MRSTHTPSQFVRPSWQGSVVTSVTHAGVTRISQRLSSAVTSVCRAVVTAWHSLPRQSTVPGVPRSARAVAAGRRRFPGLFTGGRNARSLRWDPLLAQRGDGPGRGCVCDGAGASVRMIWLGWHWVRATPPVRHRARKRHWFVADFGKKAWQACYMARRRVRYDTVYKETQ